MGRARNVDLDEAADLLYGLVPTEFTAARDALAREIKVAGDVRLSREVAKLRRPTIAAWAVNQATRRHSAELADLLDIGERLRAAWHDQDAEALAELSRRRATATSRLAGLIRNQAEASGRRLSAIPEVEQTLDAAVVDAEAAEQVRQGRLVTPLSYSGFAPASISRVSPTVPRGTAGRKQAADRPPKRDERDETRQAEERRRELEKAAEEAERAASEAERLHAQWTAELEKAAEEHDRRAKKVAELTEKLAAARAKLATAEKALAVAGRDEATTRKSAESARRKADQARRAATS